MREDNFGFNYRETPERTLPQDTVINWQGLMAVGLLCGYSSPRVLWSSSECFLMNVESVVKEVEDIALGLTAS